jgi:hypothetical protein
VAGPTAARYEFTSALPVRLLGILMPALSPLLDSPPTPTRTARLSSPSR